MTLSICSSSIVLHPRGRIPDAGKRAIFQVCCGISNKPKRSPFAPHTLESWLVSPAQKVNEKELKRNVVEFLSGEGISGKEIESLDLSLSLEIVQERLEFIRSIGLDNSQILRYPLMLTCSVKRNMVPVINYLEKLGVTPEQLPVLLQKFPMVLYSSILVDLQPVVEFLLGFGIVPEDIPKVLVRFPEVLGFQLEGTMSTSVAYLVSIGVDTRQIGPMLTSFPEIMGMKVGSNIKRKVEFYCNLGFTKKEAVDLLERHPYVLGYELDHVKLQLQCLITAGIPEKELPSLIARFPGMLELELKKKLEEKTSWLVNHVLVPESDVPVVIQKLPQILKINEYIAMKKLEFLKTAGFRDDELGAMVVRCPQILAVLFQGTLKRNLSFFLKEMNRPLSELVEFPSFLTYSLKRRILPRFRVITRRSINCSLAWFLDCSDVRFKQRMTVRYVRSSQESSLIDSEDEVSSEAETSAGEDDYDSTENSESDESPSEWEEEEEEDEEDEDGVQNEYQP